MSDVLSRRELRRRKILENAELRKQKIFGINYNCVSSDWTKPRSSDGNSSNSMSNEDVGLDSDINDHDGTESVKSNESGGSSRSNCSSFDGQSDIKKLNEILRNIPDPLNEAEEESSHQVKYVQEQPNAFIDDNSEYIDPYCDANSTFVNSSLKLNCSPNLVNDRRKTFVNDSSNFISEILEHPVAPFFLGVIVSLLISFNLGNLVSYSLIIPFCIWEIQLIISSLGLPFEGENHNAFETILLLCGIRKNIISKYMWISKMVKDFIQDLCVYIIAIVLWQICIGFHI